MKFVEQNRLKLILWFWLLSNAEVLSNQNLKNEFKFIYWKIIHKEILLKYF